MAAGTVELGMAAETVELGMAETVELGIAPETVPRSWSRIHLLVWTEGKRWSDIDRRNLERWMHSGIRTEVDHSNQSGSLHIPTHLMMTIP